MSSEKSSKDYKDTLFLPQTDFPMRANLAAREPGFLDFWEKTGVYSKLVETRKDHPPFVLHDGPPYANANIHMGTALNKVLKDIIIRYKWQRGFFSPYVPGYDTHGMPIEHKVLKDEGITVDSINPVELRRKCAQHAEKFIKIQTDEFTRLGVMGDWERPYITMTSDYEAYQMEVFAEMVDKDLVYRGRKSIFWCIDCETALAAAEIEYGDETSPSIYVSYPFPEAAEKFSLLGGRDVEVLIWTTTPWTLPASLAIAVHPEYDYSFYELGDKVLMIATGMKAEVENVIGTGFGPEVMRVKGKALECMKAIHPFYDRRVVVVLADYVTLDSGTGCVHTAPGHGVEDFETGVRYGLDIYNPVDPKGYFYPDTELVGGKSLEESERIILNELTEKGKLLGKVKLTHSYPHCWRCKKPVIFRATDQWFVSVSKFKDAALRCIEHEVEWIPAWGKDRITNMVRDRSDWCISRQRIWGVPIPAFYCKGCGNVILTGDRIKAVAKAVKEKGSNYWWEATPDELLGSLAMCPECGSLNIEKEKDIMDVWFDSGCSHRSVLENAEKWPDLHYPCEMYLEGSDQHRGWFQSSLLTSVATRNIAPYRTVLTHGFIIDDKGHKMSKSLGNAIYPQEIVEKYGADILRLWVASTDYRGDVTISQTIISNLAESYRRIRNTSRFLLANLRGFNPAKDIVPRSELPEVDRYILLKLAHLVERSTESFDEFEFHLPMAKIHQFCDNELSSFYIDISKEKLYADRADSPGRRAARSVMWEVLTTLTRLIAPVLAFTAEEIWQEIRKMDPSIEESVHLTLWPKASFEGLDSAISDRWNMIMEARGAVSRALESARTKGFIGHSLDSAVWAVLGEKYGGLAACMSDRDWETISIVSSFSTVSEPAEADVIYNDELTGIVVGVSKSTDGKCPRCWKHRPEVGSESEICSRCADALFAQSA